MKNPQTLTGRRWKIAGCARGLTLPELTLTISVVLTLMGLLFAGSSLYASHANRSSCVIAQDQIRKALIAHANMNGETFNPGVDYFALAVAAGTLEMPTTCPESGGSYTAMIDATGSKMIITCTDLGDDHRHE